MHSDPSLPAGENSSRGPSWVGCLIPIVAVVVLGGLGTCTVVTGWMQNQAIAGFTEEQPRKLEAPGRLGDADRKALAGKLASLLQAAREQRRLEVSLTAGELNELILTQPLLESLRDSTRVRRIGKAGIEVESSLPLRKLGGGMRYLNGNLVFQPAISGTNAWQLDLLAVRVPGKEVPVGFVNMARELHLFRFDLNAKELQEVLKRVERMELSDGAVLIRTREGEAAAQKF